MLPRLRRYSSYDLVASPWHWPDNLRVSSWASAKPLSTWLRKFDACRGVGNGGFRLLNISAMRRVASIYGPINTSRIHGKLGAVNVIVSIAVLVGLGTPRTIRPFLDGEGELSNVGSAGVA